MMNQIKNLINTLYRVVGNKRYMCDIERVLEALELNASDKSAFQLLALDLERLRDRYRRQSQPWR